MVDTGVTVAIVLFVVGGVLIMMAGGWVLWLLLKRRRREKRARKRREEQMVVITQSTTVDGSTGRRSVSIQKVPPPYLSVNHKKGGAKNGDDRSSAVQSSIAPQIRSVYTSKVPYIPAKDAERKNSRAKSKLSSKSSEKQGNQWVTASLSTNKSRYTFQPQQLHHPIATLPHSSTNSALVNGGSMPSLYKMRYVDTNPNKGGAKRSKGKSRRFLYMDEMTRDKRVQSWLHRQQMANALGGQSYLNHTIGHMTHEEKRDSSSPPSRASSAPIETSSIGTIDSARQQELYLRWSPNMKRRSIGSEDTGQTGTTLGMASDSFTTDPRSFIIPTKTLIAPGTVIQHQVVQPEPSETSRSQNQEVTVC